MEDGYVPIALRHGEREMRHMAHLGLSPSVRRTSCQSEPAQNMEQKSSYPSSPIEAPGCHSAPLASLAAAEVAVLRALSNSNKSKKSTESDTDASTSPGSPPASRQASRKSGSGDTSPQSLWFDPPLETKQPFDVESLTHTYTALADSKECTQATRVLGSALVANKWRVFRCAIFVILMVFCVALLLGHLDWCDITLLLFLASVAFASVEIALSYREASCCRSEPADGGEALLQS